MPRPVNASAAYHPGLDGLRTVAVGLVVAYHVGVPFAGGGLLGVGVFFTLSGFLITTLLLNRWEKHGNLGLKGFWIRRFRRLLPAVVLLLVAVLGAALFVEPHNWPTRAEEALAALVYVANWHTIATGKSYFEQQEGAAPLDHLWSLAVEEQFYIVWPLLLLAMLTLFRGRFRRAAVLTFLLGAGSMALLWGLADPLGDSTRAYEGTDTRAGGLLWGAVLAMLWRPATVARVRSAGARAALDVVGVLGLAGILGLAATFDQQDFALYQWGIAALTVATCAALMPLVHGQSVFARVMGVTPLRWIGERSYGIYLWHMPLVAYLPDRVLFGHPVLRGLLVVGLTVLLAELSWRLVEDPIRRHGVIALVTGRAHREAAAASSRSGRATAPRSRPVLAAGALGLAALSAAALVGVARLPQTSVQEIAKAEASDDGPQVPAARPVAERTACREVVHIGDSTALGPGNTDRTEIDDPALRITAQYEGVGVQDVTEDILGGRATIEHLDKDPANTNAPEAMAQHLDELGTDGCWVVNVGLNDAANIAKAPDGPDAQRRIQEVMDASGGRPVLWVTSLTMPWVNNELYKNENIQKFNDVLREAPADYPNLWVYDWSEEAESHPEWFLEDDANHNNQEGSIEKARRMARALVAAFPEGGEKAEERVVLSE